MWNWITKHKNALLNGALVAAPAVVAFIQGHVFTVATVSTFLAGLIGKLAASPLDHSTTAEDAIAAAAAFKRMRIEAQGGAK
jgi:hypothetical protein